MSASDLEGRARRILLADWDPLSIGDNPALADEYDDFIPEIVAALERDATTSELTELLLDMEQRREMPWPPRAVCEVVAGKLKAEASRSAAEGAR